MARWCMSQTGWTVRGKSCGCRGCTMVNEPDWHYLTATDRTTVPRRHVFLAADGIQRQEGAVFVRRWGAAVAVYRGAPKGRPVTEHRRGYSEVRDLWADIDKWCRPRMRTV